MDPDYHNVLNKLQTNLANELGHHMVQYVLKVSKAAMATPTYIRSP